MLDSMPVSLLIGSVLGFLAGLGIGGGSLLILWLTLVQDFSPTAARSVNLLFFIPSALIAGYFRWRQGAIPFRQILPAMVSGCLSAVAFSFLGANIHTEMLKKLFGGLLLITGLREILYKPKEKREGQ